MPVMKQLTSTNAIGTYTFRTKAFGFLLLCCLVLSACGIKLIYNRLDWVVPFYVDDYITLDEDQQITMRSAIRSGITFTL